MQRELDALCADGRLNPQAAKAYPLEEAGRAMQDMIDRKAVGRLVVTP